MSNQKRKTTKKAKSSVSAPSERKGAGDVRGASGQIRAVILFAVGIFVLFLSFVKGENVWLFLHNFLFGMFGVTGYFVSFIILYIAVMTALEKSSGHIIPKVIEGLVLLMLIGAAIQLFAHGELLGDSFSEKITNLYNSGTDFSGGGLISGLIAFPLLSLFGATGAKITVIILICAFVIIFAGITLLDIMKAARKQVKRIEDNYSERIENKKKLREDKEIDIDLGPDVSKLKSDPYAKADAIRKVEEIEKALQKESDPPAAAGFSEVHPSGMKPPKFEEILQKVSGQNAKDALSGSVKMPEKEIPSEAVSSDRGDGYMLPPLSLLAQPVKNTNTDLADELKTNAAKLVDTLKSFGVQTRIIDISKGPAVTRYELQPSAGVKISKITGLADDIALNLATAGVRIEAPIPNKAAVGIEVPNRNIDMVYLREIVDSSEFLSSKSRLTVSLGKNISGQNVVADIAKMPHMLIAGATGSGKSVCINSIIMSLLYKSTPDEVRFLMIDPKVVELGVYNGIPHLLVPVVTDPRKASGALSWAVNEMLKRYKLFAESNVKDLATYNQAAKMHDEMNPLPQIVIIIDELADLMMAAPNEVEDAICRLAQMARAAGMHLIIATQRPSVDVITGIIKANIPSRIAFAVSSQVDSRTILDGAGAEKLLGRGDMLFHPVGESKPIRIQGCFVTDKEIERVIKFIKDKDSAEYDEKIMEEIEKQAAVEKSKAQNAQEEGDCEDEMLPKAIEVVIDAGMASTSLLQRRLKLGYARAARIVDEMEQKGIVGPFEGSKPRQVLITRQQWYEMVLRNGE